MLPAAAAAFAVLHPVAVKRLVPLLVAYEILCDLVDTLLERPTPEAGDRDEVRAALGRALTAWPVGAVSPGLPDGANGGFLDELVDACRSGCAALPRYPEAQPALMRAAARSDEELVTHGLAEARAEALRVWAGRDATEDAEFEATELSATAYSTLTAHALLAAAASPRGDSDEFEAIEAAYFPWICALSALLDSLVDQEEDARTGDFSLIAQYSSPRHAEAHLRAIAEHALEGVRTLPKAHRHRALVCSLVGWYLASPSARTPNVQSVSDAVLAATAPLSSWARAVVTCQQRLLSSYE
jgi:tetraprenyl-beta-curcumene synthase